MVKSGAPSGDGGESAAAALVAALMRAEQTIATAESLTAGLAAATIAEIPGASSVLRGGLIAYATDLKSSLAGVSEDILAADGPVAATTARALAVGAMTRCKADWGIGLTGVAGPTPQDGHPVGTVFVGVGGPDGVTSLALELSGDRAAIRSAAVEFALRAVTRAVVDRLDR